MVIIVYKILTKDTYKVILGECYTWELNSVDEVGHPEKTSKESFKGHKRVGKRKLLHAKGTVFRMVQSSERA